MKTNVNFKSGVNLVCDYVRLSSFGVYLYIHEITPPKRIELMNHALANKWECEDVNTSSHPNALCINVSNDLIEQFSI